MANNVEILLCYPRLFLRLAEVSTPMMQNKISQNVNYNLYGPGCVNESEIRRNEKMTEVITPLVGFEVRSSISLKVYKILTHSYQN